MNEETKTPEPLAAILAEMREAGRSDEHADGPLIEDYADRIEAAVKRESAITDIMLAVKDKPLPHPDPDNAPPLFFPMTKTQLQTLSDLVAIAHDEMDGLPHYEQELERFDSLLFDMKARYAFDKPYTATPEHPSNAAALRAALEGIEGDCRVLDRKDMWEEEGECYYDALRDIREKVSAAIAAPARNCDRFQTELDTQLAFLNDEWLISVEKNTMMERDKFENWTEQMKTRYGRWLLAPAKKGGAK